MNISFQLELGGHLNDLYCPYFSSEVMVKLTVRVGGGTSWHIYYVDK